MNEKTHTIKLNSPTFPTPYGSTPQKMLLNRFRHVVIGKKPSMKQENKNAKAWVWRNGSSLESKESHSSIRAWTPYGWKKVSTLKKHGLIDERNEFKSFPSPERLETYTMLKSGAREAILIIPVTVMGIMLRSLLSATNIYQALFIISIFSGILNGMTKEFGQRTIGGKPKFGYDQRCIAEVFSEIMTSVTVVLCGSYNSAFRSGVKGGFKHFMEHCIKGKYYSLSLTSTGLECLRTFFKGVMKVLFQCIAVYLFSSFVVSGALGVIVGAIIGAMLINVFIDGCWTNNMPKTKNL